MNDKLVEITGVIDGFMYTYILVIMLVVAGVYFTLRTRGVQIRFIKDMFTSLTEKKHNDGEKSISSFQAMMVSTASVSARAISPALQPLSPPAAPARSSGCGQWPLSAPPRHSSNPLWRRSGR